MSKLQIVYTPETDHFRLDDIQMIGSRQPGDLLLKNLRNNYQRLRESFADLPLEIGIVTYDWLFKKHSRKKLQEVREDPLIKSTTTYILLDIFREALDLRNQDYLNNPIAGEMVYRTLTHLMSHESICVEGSLIGRKEIMFAPEIPSSEKVIVDFNQTLKNIKELEGSNVLASRLEETIEKLKEAYSNFDQLEVVYQEIQKRFEANKVSQDFPLYFLPKDYFFASIYLVSLMDKIETLDCIPHILEYIRKGCKAGGLKEIPEDVKKMVMIGQKDRFGETKRVGTLDKLLSNLPEPQTIITDLYIVDRFPQIAGMEFETHEFRL